MLHIAIMFSANRSHCFEKSYSVRTASIDDAKAIRSFFNVVKAGLSFPASVDIRDTVCSDSTSISLNY
jgi:hypothetical protein